MPSQKRQNMKSLASRIGSTRHFILSSSSFQKPTIPRRDPSLQFEQTVDYEKFTRQATLAARSPLASAKAKLSLSQTTSTVDQWKQRAEDAESKLATMQEKIHSLVQGIKDLKERAKNAELRSSEVEDRLLQILDKVKSLSVNGVSLRSAVEDEKAKEMKRLRALLKEQKEINEQQQEEINYLRRELEAKDKGSIDRSPFDYYRPPRLRAIALYDFEAQTPDDLSFKDGEVISVLKKYMDGWWLGELNGHIGKLPSNFIEEFVEENIPVVGVSDFEGEQLGDLPFKESDIMFVLKREEEWCLAESMERQIGWIPSSLIQEVEIVYDE